MTEPMGAPKGRTALYRLFDADDVLLYIGIAYDPDERWGAHRYGKSNAGMADVARRTLEWFGDRAAAEAAEKAAIKAERPRLNGTYNYPDVEFDPAWWSEMPAGRTRPLQIAELIRREVVSGRWPPGGRIPSLRVLAEAAGSSMSPASKAVGLLQREGLLTLRAGEGIFVSA